MSTAEDPDASPRVDVVPFRDAVKAWALVSVQSFGGPAGQIAVMQRLLVDERRWIGRGRFLHALNFCTLLPGPEAQQLAVYLGWLLNGVRGGLVAGTLFVLPGIVALLALSATYVAYGDTEVVSGLFAGIAPAVLAIVVEALLRVARRALHRWLLRGLALAAFLGLAVFNVPFPVVVAGAAVVGWLTGRRRAAPPEPADSDGALIADDAATPGRRTRPWRVLAVGLLAWGVPMAAVLSLAGSDSTLAREGWFFSGTAVVGFGGAYAVLSFVAQQAVQQYGWLTAGEMVKGLALAETTPGPLIMVLQFVGFLGAYRDPGSLDPWVAGVLGALLTTWVTFVPSFVLVFLGAPYVERLRHQRGLAAALSGVTAAVVGVIANLALYFAVHTIFARVETSRHGPVEVALPDWGSIRLTALGIAVVAGLLVFVARWSVLRVLGVCGLLGLAATLLG